MPIKEFQVDFLYDAIWGKYNVEVLDGDHSRWSEERTVVFRDPDSENDSYWYSYESGLTENQEDYFPWGYHYGGHEDDETWPCEQVEQYEETVVVKKYRVV